MQGRRAGALACMRRGARAGAECGQHAQPWGAGFWAAGARALGAGAGSGLRVHACIAVEEGADRPRRPSA